MHAMFAVAQPELEDSSQLEPDAKRRRKGSYPQNLCFHPKKIQSMAPSFAIVCIMFTDASNCIMSVHMQVAHVFMNQHNYIEKCLHGI